MHHGPPLPTQSPVVSAVAILVALWVGCFSADDVFSIEPNAVAPKTPDLWIETLGHDSYMVRKSAERSLLAQADDVNVRSLLVEALRNESLEIRHAARSILKQFEHQRFEEQFARLSEAGYPPRKIQLPGWQRFDRLAGHDRAARDVFGRIVRRYERTLRSLERDSTIPGFEEAFDPYRISKGDSICWAMLLMVYRDEAGQGFRAGQSVSDLADRIVNALCNSGLGPEPSTTSERVVISRLISHWLSDHSNVGTPREHLMVAIRYDCQEYAQAICQKVFADAHATPTSQAAAMLAGNVLNGTDLRSHLENRLDDDRTAHVWQLIASRKTKIRTQIRDVALALLLHRNGIDPRRVGFVELQADPLFVFRDHSLGFSSEQERRTAHTRARRLLANKSFASNSD